MKSMCHDVRRNSPSVAACRPTRSCIATAARIASSSAARSAVTSISPAACAARAASRAGGRSRLPDMVGAERRHGPGGHAPRLVPRRATSSRRHWTGPWCDSGRLAGMDDTEMHRRIDELVAEEHRLERAHVGQGISDAEQARLDDLGVQLDRTGTSCASATPAAARASTPTASRSARRRGGGLPPVSSSRPALSSVRVSRNRIGRRGLRGARHPHHPGRSPRRSSSSSPPGPGRVRLVLDGPPPARPGELAAEVATALRARGRATVVVDAADFLRPASVRLEQGRTDPDALLDGWLDDAALRREVLDPAAPDGSGQVLPRLWNTRTDRAYRDGYTALPADGVVLLHGALLLGRGLPPTSRCTSG